MEKAARIYKYRKKTPGQGKTSLGNVSIDTETSQKSVSLRTTLTS